MRILANRGFSKLQPRRRRPARRPAFAQDFALTIKRAREMKRARMSNREEVLSGTVHGVPYRVLAPAKKPRHGDWPYDVYYGDDCRSQFRLTAPSGSIDHDAVEQKLRPKLRQLKRQRAGCPNAHACSSYFQGGTAYVHHRAYRPSSAFGRLSVAT